jgi:hypothetical protein
MRNVLFVTLTLTAMSSVGCGNRDTSTATPGGAPETASGTGQSAEVQTTLAPPNLEALMKKIGPAYQSMRKHLQDGSADEAGKEAQELGELFGHVEKFWAQHNRNDAVKWAQQARTFASEVAGASVGGDPKKAATLAENMGGACKQCHGTYRESDGLGGYRIKPGIITP